MTSPCTTCATMADCSSCPAFDAWLESLAAPAAECLTCVDIRWLLTWGERLDAVAERLGITRNGLTLHARRHGLDLGRWLDAEKEQRDADRARRQRVTL